MSEAQQRIIEIDTNLRVKPSHIQQRDQWVECRLDGFLDNENTPRFLDFARRQLHDGCVVMGLDLSGLSYISSTGVGAFSSLTLESRGTGKFFFLTGIPDRIAKVLTLLGVSDLFSMVDDSSVYRFEKHLL